MTDAEMARLDEIESRLRAATPAPWVWRDDTQLVNPNLYQEFMVSVNDGPAYWAKRDKATVLEACWCNEGTADLAASGADRQLVVNAPTDIAWLIAQLRKK
jgi:hypothetical protein